MTARAPIALWIRAQLRHRRRAALGLAVLAALAAVMPLVASAGARRTATSLDRMRDELRPRHLDVQFHGDAPPAGTVERLASLPGVVDVGEVANMLARPKGSERDQFDAFGHGGMDERLGSDFDIPRLTAGRRPMAADEVLVSSRLAAELGLGVGDTLVLETYTPNTVESIFLGTPATYDGPEVALRVVGVGRQPEELTAGEESPSPLFLLAPAFFDEWAEKLHFFTGIFVVRLAEGPDGIRAFEQAARAAFPDRDDLNVHVSEESARIDDAISTQTTALALLALAAMVSGAIALAQAAIRFARSSAAEQEILGVLGLDGRALAVGRVGATTVPVVSGIVVAIALAIGLSGLFPTGPAGRLEPDPGIRMEAPVLLLGAVVLLLVALAATALFGRGRTGRAVVQPSRVAQAVSRTTALVSVGVGVRSALQADGGPRAVPVRSAMIASGAGLAGLVAALVFAANLHGLVGDPVRQGWNWDYEAALGDELTDEAALEQAETVIADNRVDGAFYARVASKAIGDEEVLTYGVEPLRAGLGTAIVDGRNVRSDNEIVLGRTTLDQIGRDVGDRLEVEGPEGKRALQIVGQGLFPTTENDDPAAGAIVTRATMEELPGSDGYPNLYLTVAPGADETAFQRHLEERGIFVAGPRAAPVVANLDRVDRIPYVLAAYLGLLAVATIAHALLTAIRRRRRELAILKAVGFVRSQVAATVLSQAVTFAVVGLVIGLPVGVALGRWTWRLTASRLGFAADADIPLLVLVAVVPMAIGTAVLIASAPAWWAARTRPASILRTE